MNVINKIRTFVGKINIARAKKITYITCAVLLGALVIYRFVAFILMQRADVFNPNRDSVINGVPVSVVAVHEKTDVLRQPIFVKNNRAYVSGGRVSMFHVGDNVDGGKIASVGYNIDLDTGMHIITTRGVSDGQHYAEHAFTGYFIPVDAIDNGAVYIVDGDVARRVQINITYRDETSVVVSHGLSNGDMVINSRVSDGQKIQIKQ